MQGKKPKKKEIRKLGWRRWTSPREGGSYLERRQAGERQHRFSKNTRCHEGKRRTE
jgi:hypothetical protein